VRGEVVHVRGDRRNLALPLKLEEVVHRRTRVRAGSGRCRRRRRSSSLRSRR
jgi:hypothetical protein